MFALICLVASLAGDPVIVHLRDGRVIKGVLLKENPDDIHLNRKGVKLTLNRRDILKITKDGSPPAPTPPAPPPDLFPAPTAPSTPPPSKPANASRSSRT